MKPAFLAYPEDMPGPLAAGLDEAGRGCLAGPVAAAAVILPAVFNLPGLTDSKKLSEKARERLRLQIRSCALAWSIGLSWPRRIEEINILNASLEAMAKAAATLRVKPRYLLIDGNRKIPGHIIKEIWLEKGAPPAQRAIVGGDATVAAISAASIMAKTFRDRLMAVLGRRWPEYGFEKHKGYGTKAHMAAILKFGPCPLHRMTFGGVRQDGISQGLLT